MANLISVSSGVEKMLVNMDQALLVHEEAGQTHIKLRDNLGVFVKETLAQIQSLVDGEQWRTVLQDGFPEKGKWCVIYSSVTGVFGVSDIVQELYEMPGFAFKATHWMPLPEVPGIAK